MLQKKVPISSCFLRNRGLEHDPRNQKTTTLYKTVLESIRQKGLTNPLTVVTEGDKYKVCIGNNRYLACKELGIKEVTIIIAESEDKDDLHKSYKYYKNELKTDRF